MGKRSNQTPLFLCASVVALLSLNLVFPVKTAAANFQAQKTYYPRDPNAGTPPIASSPPGGGHATPTPSTPSHGTPSTPSHGTPSTPSHGTPSTPSHGTPSTPSHGDSSHHGGTPPTNCGNPPTPSGGHHHATPLPPQHGGGGYYHSPPSTPTTPTTPTTPITPVTPTTPITPTTPTPVVVDPPTIVSPPTFVTPPSSPIIIPGIPTTPGITIPSPPFAFDPNSPPFSCNYWRNHPTLVWGLFGVWGTSIGGVFGTTSLPGLGASSNLLDALSNTRTDGLGELYREGTAALLNSMVHGRFPYTTSQVRDSFVAALSSNKAAAAQARLFKQANQGKASPRA